MYNPEDEHIWRESIVETMQKTAGIGERVLARLGSKGVQEVPIKIKKMDNNGNISFTVKSSDLVSDEELQELQGSIPLSRRFGTFFVDSIGELLVRRNLETFLGEFVKIKNSDIERLSKMQHATFGLMEKSEKNLCFIFHVSLLQRIFVDMVGMLTEKSED